LVKRNTKVIRYSDNQITRRLPETIFNPANLSLANSQFLSELPGCQIML